MKFYMYKETYQELKGSGFCVACKKPRGKTGTTIYCRGCADKAAERTKRRLGMRAAQGKCVRCGKPRGRNATLVHCRECADEMNLKSRTVWRKP